MIQKRIDAMGRYPTIFIASLAVLAVLITASAGGNDLDGLKQLISSLNDPKMTISDLAFFLATHDYDARPANDYVEIKQDGKVYKLIPNGGDSGLCKIIPADGLN